HARRSLDKCASKLKTREVIDRRLAKRNELVDYHIQRRHLSKRQFGPPLFPPMLPPQQGNETDTCILTPEVTVGPYYVQEELIRKDIREGQDGIDLLLDLQFVDVNTCEPVPRAMIDVWHCNTTGSYSGFEVEQTADESFNRGLQPTDEHGIMHILTNFPGWYQGRATHIHIAAHINGHINKKNRTYVGGTTTHIGQVFFPETMLEAIAEFPPYNTNEVTRLLNAEDGIFGQENTGYNAVSEVRQLGRSLDDGVIAFISIGIDLTANHTDALL
ncbi:Intradiol ring-cleavage dioxygenase, partial [Geopyxis carbonaria]